MRSQDKARSKRPPTGRQRPAIGGAVIHPMVLGLDDDTLRTELLRLARRLFDLPDAETRPR